MQLITDAQRAQMLVNGERSARGDAYDPFPVVRLLTTDGACRWYLTALDPDLPNIAFGFVDHGNGYPQFAAMRLSEIAGLRDRNGLTVERDLGFVAHQPISWYAALAASCGTDAA